MTGLWGPLRYMFGKGYQNGRFIFSSTVLQSTVSLYFRLFQKLISCLIIETKNFFFLGLASFYRSLLAFQTKLGTLFQCTVSTTHLSAVTYACGQKCMHFCNRFYCTFCDCSFLIVLVHHLLVVLGVTSGQMKTHLLLQVRCYFCKDSAY